MIPHHVDVLKVLFKQIFIKKRQSDFFKFYFLSQILGVGIMKGG